MFLSCRATFIVILNSEPGVMLHMSKLLNLLDHTQITYADKLDIQDYDQAILLQIVCERYLFHSSNAAIFNLAC